jgi:hypothetical protein
MKKIYYLLSLLSGLADKAFGIPPEQKVNKNVPIYNPK